MKYYEGRISGHEDKEILDIIQNLPSLEMISVTLPEINEKTKDEIIELMDEPISGLTSIQSDDEETKERVKSLLEHFRSKGYGNNHSFEDGVLKIRGWEHIERLLRRSHLNSFHLDGDEKIEWDKLISHITYHLLLIGLPYEGVVHVPQEKRTFTGKLSMGKITHDTYIINQSSFVGPTIPFHERFKDYMVPCINYIIELPDGRICGFDPVGVHLSEYVPHDHNIYIDDAVVEELGIKSGQMLKFRLFLFARDLLPIYIHEPGQSIKEIIPKGSYHA